MPQYTQVFDPNSGEMISVPVGSPVGGGYATQGGGTQTTPVNPAGPSSASPGVKGYTGSAGQQNGFGFGIAYFDPFSGQAMDANGQPIIDDGSNPGLTSAIEAARRATTGNKLESDQRDAATKALGQSSRAVTGALAENYDPGGYLLGYADNERKALEEQGSAAAALRGGFTNQPGINNSFGAQERANRNIAGSDAANNALAGEQYADWGGDMASFRDDIGILRDTALGRGPSAAQALAKAQLDDSIRSQSAMAATARGGNVAAGLRAASRAGTDLQLRNLQQMAALRASEQLQGQGQLASAQQGLGGLQAQRGGLLQDARGNDINKALGGASAANALTGQQLALGGLQTEREGAAAGAAFQGVQGRGQARLTAQEELRNKEDARQARARLALQAQESFGGQATQREQGAADRTLQAKIAAASGNITPKDIAGGIFSAGGAALGGVFGAK